jgi:hypothetical protein
MAAEKPFPAIKHVRTFIIQGVGSGGDYHNVSMHLCRWLCLDAKVHGNSGERRTLASGQLYIDSNGAVGGIPRF